MLMKFLLTNGCVTLALYQDYFQLQLWLVHPHQHTLDSLHHKITNLDKIAVLIKIDLAKLLQSTLKVKLFFKPKIFKLEPTEERQRIRKLILKELQELHQTVIDQKK